MKVAVLQENLLAGLNAVMGTLNSRPSLPILSNVLIRAEDGRLTIAATNLELGAEAQVGAKIDEDGAITVPAKTFKDLIATLPPERVDLALNEKTQTLKIACAGTSANIKGISAEEYPPIGFVESREVASIAAGSLRELIGHTAFAAAKDDNRPVLTGIEFKLSAQTLAMAAADGYRLALRTLQHEGDEDVSLIIPARSLLEVSRVTTGDSPVTILVSKDCVRVAFVMESVAVYSQVIEGKFPNVQQIVPPSYKTSATVDTQELLRACKRAEIFARGANNTMRLKLKRADSALVPGVVTVTAQSQEQGDNEGRLDATITGDDFDGAFNVRYLLEVLGVIKEAQVVIEANAANAPLSLHPAGRDDFNHIIMPMSVTR